MVTLAEQRKKKKEEELRIREEQERARGVPEERLATEREALTRTTAVQGGKEAPIVTRRSEELGQEFALPVEAPQLGTAPAFQTGTFAEQQAAREAEDVAIAQGERTQATEELTDPLISQLETGIEQPRSLAPQGVGENILESAGSFGAKQAVGAANFLKAGFEKLFGLEEGSLGRTTEEQFFETKLPGTDIKPGKFLGPALTVAETAAIATLGAAAIPVVLKTSAGTAIATKVAGTSTLVKVATIGVVGTALGFNVRSISDPNREKINNLKTAITEAGSTSSTVLSAFDGGADGFQTVRALETLADSLDYSETELIKAARFNLKFRSSDEYIKVAAQTSKARREILERINAVKTAMITGTKSVNPEGLMIDIARMGAEE